jgi:hypothetical protein
MKVDWHFLSSFRLIPYNFTGGPDMVQADASDVTDISPMGFIGGAKNVLAAYLSILGSQA